MRPHRSDIALIHPPYILAGDNYAIFPLPWNLNHIGSTHYIGRYPVGPHWDVLPLGFFTMKHFIETHSSYSVKIYNLAQLSLGMPAVLHDRFKDIYQTDPSILHDLSFLTSTQRSISFIKSIKSDLIAVGLHWLNFSQGAIEVLRLVKKIHPSAYTVVGGITATYFRDEIMQLFPFIDFLIIGDGCLPLLALMDAVRGKGVFSKVPNLLYRQSNRIKSSKSESINDFSFAQKDEKLCATIPTSRGCPMQCVTCGGSHYGSRNVLGYTEIRSYSIESIMRKLCALANSQTKDANPFLVHDPFFTIGKKRWQALLDEIKRNRLKIRLDLEFFSPHSKEDILNIAEKLPGSIIHISPETMDVRVRSLQKNLVYSNQELVMNMDTINHIDSLSMRVWFMSGLAQEKKQNVDATLHFIKNYYKKIKNKQKDYIQYNELLFLDPGSLAFNHPEKYGYYLTHRHFLAYLESFIMPIFEYQINYRTKHFSRNNLFKLFLSIHNQMDKIYYEHDIIPRHLYERAVLYNRLLKKYSPFYTQAFSEMDIFIRNKQFEAIGNKFRSELER
jgi:radical SAM superfamily enzyme YgiQ (UPF0313 family)